MATTVANLSISEECKASSACYGSPAAAAATTDVVLQKYINEGETEEARVHFVKACPYSVQA